MSIRHRHALHEGTEAAAIARLRRSLIRLQDETRLLRRDLLRRKYDPSQPRVPAGSSGGGQWTSGAGGGGSPRPMPGFGPEGGLAEAGPGDGFIVDETGEESWAFYEESRDEAGDVAERAIVNRDGSTIHSEYAASRQTGFDERHTVTTPEGDKVTFETTERTQTIRFGGPGGDVIARSVWTPDGPSAPVTVQPVFADKLLANGAVLFGWLSSQNGDGLQAVMGFNAREFRPGTSNSLQLGYVGQLSEEEVEAACYRWRQVEGFAARAANAAGPVLQYPSMAVYGTAVHSRFKTYVDDQHDWRFQAERSFLKEQAEPMVDPVPYGYRGSVRVDAYEYRDDGTLCIYDLKTGKSIVQDRRAEILATAVSRGLAPIRRVIVTEVRPLR